MVNCMIGIALFPSASTFGAPPPTAIVTILTGKATVIRGLSQFDAADGVRLSADDLVRTGKDTFLRIEYEDQSSIELGPQTQLQLNYPAVRKKSNRPGLYVLEGWVKLGAGKPDGADKPALAAIGMDVTDITGVMVLRAGSAACEWFAEQGSARLVDRDHHVDPVRLKQGDFLTAAPGRAPRLEPRPSADFIAALPQAYRDTLPLRFNVFKEHVVVPENTGTFAYADVESWINAEPSMRRLSVSCPISWTSNPLMV